MASTPSGMYLLAGQLGRSERIGVILLFAAIMNATLHPGKSIKFINKDTGSTCDCLMQAELPICSDP